MARINTNIPSMIAQAHLRSTNAELGLRLERLSTGLRINRGSDDPAGLITSERIRSDLEGVRQALRNAERSSNVIATTEASLAEVNDLLNSIRALIVEAANTGANSEDERNANQLQIDSAIDSITRISNTATFGGLKLLNGSLDYTMSGLAPSAIDHARITHASFVGNAAIQVDVDVIASAQTGNLFYNGGTTPPGEILSTVTLEIAGPKGVQVLTFASGIPLSDVANAINKLSSATGLKAELINGNVNSGVVFSSVDYGSASFVSVKRLNPPNDPGDDAWILHKFNDGVPMPDYSGGFPWTDVITATRDIGQDVSALVNGIVGSGNGLRVKLSTQTLGVDLLLDADFATDPASASSTFYVTGGGAMFQVGPEVSIQQQINIGIPSVAASNLGATLIDGTLAFLSSLKSGGENSITASMARNDFTGANQVIAAAIDETSVLRGRLGAFERNVVQTNVRSMQAAFENLSASSSAIRDADFALETSQLNRAQILASAGATVLTIANQQAQQVLQLLG